MMRLSLDGDDLATLTEQARAQYGVGFRVVGAEKLRDGGVMGFFAKERYRLTIEIPDEGEELGEQMAAGSFVEHQVRPGQDQSETGPQEHRQAMLAALIEAAESQEASVPGAGRAADKVAEVKHGTVQSNSAGVDPAFKHLVDQAQAAQRPAAGQVATQAVAADPGLSVNGRSASTSQPAGMPGARQGRRPGAPQPQPQVAGGSHSAGLNGFHDTADTAAGHASHAQAGHGQPAHQAHAGDPRSAGTPARARAAGQGSPTQRDNLPHPGNSTQPEHLAPSAGAAQLTAGQAAGAATQNGQPARVRPQRNSGSAGEVSSWAPQQARPTTHRGAQAAYQGHSNLGQANQSHPTAGHSNLGQSSPGHADPRHHQAGQPHTSPHQAAAVPQQGQGARPGGYPQQPADGRSVHRWQAPAADQQVAQRPPAAAGQSVGSNHRPLSVSPDALPGRSVAQTPTHPAGSEQSTPVGVERYESAISAPSQPEAGYAQAMASAARPDGRGPVPGPRKQPPPQTSATPHNPPELNPLGTTQAERPKPKVSPRRPQHQLPLEAAQAYGVSVQRGDAQYVGADDDPMAGRLRRHVRDRGFPRALLELLPQNAHLEDLLGILKRLPTAEIPAPTPGFVAAVVGASPSTTAVASRLGTFLGASQLPVTESHSVTSNRQARAGAERIRTSDGVGALAMPLRYENAESAQNAATMISITAPDAVIVCVDAGRKPSDTRAFIQELIRQGVIIDGLAVVNARHTSEPATVLELGIGVWELDGAQADPLSWMPVLLSGFAE